MGAMPLCQSVARQRLCRRRHSFVSAWAFLQQKGLPTVVHPPLYHYRQLLLLDRCCFLLESQLLELVAPAQTAPSCLALEAHRPWGARRCCWISYRR
jgi:hypothetical protein